MSSQSLVVEKVGSRRKEVRAHGSVVASDVAELTRQLLSDDMGMGWELLVDLTEMTGFDADARLGFQALQRSLAAHEVRTAFVADCPRVRGLALWLAHTSNDPLARPFHQRNQAESWLAAREGRVQSITEYLERARTGRDREPTETPSQKLRRMRIGRDQGGNGG